MASFHSVPRFASGFASRFASRLVPSASASSRPLLQLESATAEWRAGAGPGCAATVRLLDRVTLTVHAGECVLLHHTDPAGVEVLLSVLTAGLAREARLVRGRCVRRAGVLVRRASIRVDLVPTLVSAWAAEVHPGDWRRATEVPETPVVHVLRATRPHGTSAVAHEGWRRWAAAQREAGGALVLVTDGRGVLAAAPRARDGHPRGPRAVRELPAGHDAAATDEARTGASAVRACQLRHGRLVAAPAELVAAGYGWPSEAPLVVGP